MHGRQRGGCFVATSARCSRFQRSDELLRVQLVLHTFAVALKQAQGDKTWFSFFLAHKIHAASNQLRAAFNALVICTWTTR